MKNIILILVLLIFLSGCATGPKEGSAVNQISNLEEDYLLDLDRFLEEYSTAFGNTYDTDIKINDGLSKFSELASKKTALEDTTNQIKNLADPGFSESNNDVEKQYYESVSKCYTERIKILDNTEEVIKNYQKSLRYMLHAITLKKSYNDLLTEIDSYTSFAEKEDAENSIKALNTMQSKVKSIREATIAAKEEISLSYQDSLIQWADQYNEILDLSKQGWQKTGSEREALFTRVVEKSAKIGKSLDGAEVEEQEKNWHYENIEKLDSASTSAFNEANRQCEKAAEKYGELY